MAASPSTFLGGFELPALPLTHPGSQVTFQEPKPLEPPVIFSLGLVKKRRQIQVRGYEIDFGIFLSIFSFSQELLAFSLPMSPRATTLMQAIKM